MIDENLLIAGTIIGILLIVAFALLAYEQAWISGTTDYTKCLSHCAEEFDGDDSMTQANKLSCQKECSSLSDCYQDMGVGK